MCILTVCINIVTKKRKKQKSKIKIIKKKPQSKDKNKQTNKQILTSLETRYQTLKNVNERMFAETEYAGK